MLGKALLILGAISLSLTVYHFTRPSDVDMNSLWTSWKAQYGVTYDDASEDQYRLSVFTANYKVITEHNAKGDTYWMTLNKFSALTPQEFKDQYASGIRVDPLSADPYCPSASTSCPSFPVSNAASQNWTALGAVTPVKNQGSCGSCYSFSATGGLEGLVAIKTGKLNSYSEQQIVDCDTSCYGCEGCWVNVALEYTAAYGSESEAQYPYTGKEATCKYNSKYASQVNTGYKCIAQSSLPNLKGAAAQQPVSVAVQADQAAWQHYAGGVVSSGCGNLLNHAVLVTGWAPISSTNAWIVKNSWGADWGNNGYIYISQSTTSDKYGVCGILRCAVVPY